VARDRVDGHSGRSRPAPHRDHPQEPHLTHPATPRCPVPARSRRPSAKPRPYL